MKKLRLISIITVCTVILATVVFLTVYYTDCGRRGFCLTHKYKLYDHIRYNGDDYYLIDTLIDIDCASDFNIDCSVQLIDSAGCVHSEKYYTGYLLPNDFECVYLYFQNCFYTKDISEAGSWYGLCE